jgi:hypothetical protein
VVETESVNSTKAAPLDGYNAYKSQAVRVIGLTLEGVTVVPEHGFTTVRVKLDGVASEEKS